LLLAACRAAGIEVVECHRPLWETTPHKDAAYFGLRSAVALGQRYVANGLALARDRRSLGFMPLYVVGFGGQLDCIWLRLLLRLHRERGAIVLAPLVTLSETLIDDRAVFRPGSLRSRLAMWIDRRSLTAATHVLIDTEAHRRYLTATFGIPAERTSAWYLGTDPTVFVRKPLPEDVRPLRVLFFASFLPLHGAMVVLQAAERLKHRDDIEWTMLGDGPGRAAAEGHARAAGLTHVRFRDWVTYRDLADVVANAHICLGIFGTSEKARMVIPNKVYEAAAVGRPIITADTPAVREVFVHGDNIWLCPGGDAAALASAIELVAADSGLRRKLAAGAATVMRDRFSVAAQAQRLAAAFAAAVEPQ
jgi:glycosyltransferase involved in cell wall biosynthesis